MFNWLFGKTQPQKKPPIAQSQKKWKYEALLQFLVSKQWKVTVLNFIDNNCLVFDNEQENKFQYTIIHNKFKELISGLFDSMMNELGLDQDLLMELIEKGLKSSINAKVFEQLLYIDDFMKFKGMMLKRNAKLEEQALAELSKSNNFHYEGEVEKEREKESVKTQVKMSKVEEESEEQVIKRIMEMSLKQEQDRKRQRESLDKEQENKVKSAIQQSQIFESQLINQKGKQEQKQRNIERERQLMKIKEEKLSNLKEKKQKLQQKRRQEQQFLLQKQQQRHRQEQQQQQRQRQQRIRQQQLQKQYQLQKVTKQETNKHLDQETIQNRKRRLLEQREILRKKKMDERNQEVEKGDGKQTILLGEVLDSKIVNQQQERQEEKIPQSEIERRRELMKKIKNKIVEDY